MTAVKRKLRRAMSVFLALVMVVSMGVPMQAQASNATLDQSVQLTNESTGNDTEQPEESKGTNDSEDSEESQGADDSEDSEESQGTDNPEDSKGSEGKEEQEDPKDSEEKENPEDSEGPKAPEDSEESEDTLDEDDSEEPEDAQEQEQPEEEEPKENITKAAKAFDEPLEFNADSKYAIVATSGLALRSAATLSWQNPAKIQTVYNRDENLLVDMEALFVITPQESSDELEPDEIRVKIKNYFGDYPLRTEGELEYAFADPEMRYDVDCEYIIQRTADNKGIIKKVKENKTRYASVNETGDLCFNNTTVDADDETVEVFEFVENPKLMDLTVSIQHVKSGKFIKTYSEANVPLTVDGEKDKPDTIFSKALFGTSASIDGADFATVDFISQAYGNGIKSVNWVGGADGYGDASNVLTSNADNDGNGWESIRIIGNEDGTVFFKDSYYDEYITVEDGKLKGRSGKDKGVLTDNDNFILYTGKDVTPLPVTDFAFDASSRTQTTIDLSWKNPQSLFTGIELYQKGPNDAEYTRIAFLGEGEESYTAEGLTKGAEYSFKIHTVLYNGEDTLTSEDSEITAATRLNEKPAVPQNVHIEEIDGKFKITWDAVADVTGYKILRAPSLYGRYELAMDLDDTVAEAIVAPEGADKYSNYYRVIAMQGDEKSDESDAVSLETEMFGDHTIIFAETDETDKIDTFLQDLFDKQNDYNADAQFKGEQWQVYFKPGDYTTTSCMYLGFYTSFNGLGKTPYDVKLNNIAIPAYLPAGALGGQGDNATCNFWRSAENLSIINTGNAQGNAGYGSWRPEYFNWAVAQAAPLRRVYSQRKVAYDWQYGWASGGYVADCFIDASGDDAAGTWSGQQFFTRNTKVSGNTFGTTLNNFFMGVEAANNLNNQTGQLLKNNNGYSNWGIANDKSDQQVVTEITETPKISEKPFLYLDNGEYKVFVPAVRENTRGISWSETNMGEGTSLSLDAFYIAKPTDTAAKINQEIVNGKNIYFTPGTYHAEVPIRVDRENTILLGTGMASIIPDNGEMALYVGDKDGIRIEGLIFDAGKSSKLLLQVGEKGIHTDHSANPIVLQDLFFRVGGTTDVLTKADDALEINSDDVIGDHFWIWRADHGAGVEWYGNESKHGLIVNGDDVTCYALFNEHFQEYHTLWNGENGATYFYQNETCYDPISQDAWMSHNGETKGYSSYKVSNDVKNHYAVGLGIYNVFIYTGPSYDASGIGIELDNAIEVPNSPGVLVENACTQTFANSGNDFPLCRINHIVNGVGGSVSSGQGGEDWSRKFLLYYCNGAAAYGKETNGSDEQKGKFIGIDEAEENEIEAPADETIYLGRIEGLYKEFSDKDENDYTQKSWQNAGMSEALINAKKQIDLGNEILTEMEKGKTYTQSEISALQTQINKACSNLEAASERLIHIGNAAWLQEMYADYEAKNYATTGWEDFDKARQNLNEVLDKVNQADTTVKKEIYNLELEVSAACEAVQQAADKLTLITLATVTEVRLNKESYTLRTGNTLQLKATVLPSNASNKNVTWSSSNEKIATVDESGNVRAVGESGTAVITVTTEDGGFTANCEITVSIRVFGIRLSEKSVILETGSTIALKADVYPEDAANKNITWSSSDEKVATVDENGKVTVVGESGTATITVTTEDGGHTANCVITVLVHVTRVELSEKSVTLDTGKTITLKADVYPKDAANKNITWSSSDEKVATVDENGKVTAVSVGTATITVTTEDGGHTADCTVTVTESKDPVDPDDPDPVDPDDPDPVDPDDPDPDDPDPETPDGLYIRFVTEDGTETKEGSYLYTGKAIKPQVHVYDSGKLLTEKKDYTISYKNNTKANYDPEKPNKLPQVVVKGKGNYAGTETKAFEIVKPNVGTDGAFSVEDVIVAYNKKAQKPVPKLLWNGKSLKNKTDYQITYYKLENNEDDEESTKTECTSVKDAGEYEIKLEGKGNFTGERTINLTVTNLNLISKVTVSKVKPQTYTGSSIPIDSLGITVKKGGIVLEKDTDYEVYYEQEYIDIGTAYVVIKGIGDYIGIKRVSFQIVGAALSKVAEAAAIESQVYTGEDIEPAVNLTLKEAREDNTTDLKEKDDYTVTYQNNRKVGTATVVFTGKGAYTGTLKKTFKILPYDVQDKEGEESKIKVEYDSSVPYTKGGAKQENLTVTFDGTTLTEGTDYTVSYKKNTKVTVNPDDNTADNAVDKAGLTIKGKGNFKGSRTVEFDITPQDIGKLTLSAPDKGHQNKNNNYVTKITIYDRNGKALKAGTDYNKTMEYFDSNGEPIENNARVDAGDVIHVKVTGKVPYYTGTIEGDYRITTLDFSKATISINPQIYTGQEITLNQSAFKKVKVGREDITENFGTDYEIVPGSYKNNIAKGTASVTIRGKGSYGGEKTVKFKITAKKLSWGEILARLFQS